MSATRPDRLVPAAATRTIDVLLVSFNSAHLLGRLHRTLEEAGRDGLALRLLVVDNCSTDRSAQALERNFRCDVLIRNTENVGFGRANNQLLAHVKSEYALLLNTDAFVAPDTIATTIRYMDEHPRCGIVGVRLTDDTGGLQPSRRSFPTPFTTFLRRTGLEKAVAVRGARHDIEEDHGRVAECDWVPGCYYMVRRTVLQDIGLFDPRFFLYFEEVDHCRRARAAGWTVCYLPATNVVHVGGESAKSVAWLSADRQISPLHVESELLYMRKHFGAAGLARHLVLVLLGDAVLASKDLLKRRGAVAAASRFRNTRLTWRLVRRTKAGTRPTR